MKEKNEENKETIQFVPSISNKDKYHFDDITGNDDSY